MAERTLYYRAHVLADPRVPRIVDALAVHGDRIVMTGDVESCAAALGPGHRRVDMHGAFIVPGFTDGHIHFASYARSLAEVDLSGAASLDDALSILRRHVQGLAPDEWVIGGNWYHDAWPGKRFPDRLSLDSVVPDRPAVLRSKDWHSIWVNSRALELAGIDAGTPDPDGGRILHTPAGEPSGILQERAQEMIWRLYEGVPRLPLEDVLARAFASANALGITSIHDFDGMDAADAYQSLRERDALRLRVFKSVPMTSLDEAIASGIQTGQGDEWFRFGPMKLFSDGALGSRSAAMLEPYGDDTDNSGVQVLTVEEMASLIGKAAAGGIASAIHAIGDRANRNVLDAFERAYAAYDHHSIGGLRHRIEHVQHVHPDDLPRLARLDITASMQPQHSVIDMRLVDSVLGRRPMASYAWQSLLRSGAQLVFGSDAPIEPPIPLRGIHDAVTRQDQGWPEGGWQPHERISPGEAIAAYTTAPALASGESMIKGVLAPGMLADFVALSENLLTCEPADIADVRVLMTCLGGEIVYGG